jgi:hypothetical protein
VTLLLAAEEAHVSLALLLHHGLLLGLGLSTADSYHHSLHARYKLTVLF